MIYDAHNHASLKVITYSASGWRGVAEFVTFPSLLKLKTHHAQGMHALSWSPTLITHL